MPHVAKITLVAAAFLTACAPLQIFYKEGETVARMDADITGCDVSALAQVPQDIRTRYIPPTYAPYQSCNGAGNCYWHQHIISPGHFERYDANAPLRRKASDQCMIAKGYAKTEIPRCDSAIKQNTAPQPTQVLPPLNSQSCAIRLKSGRWQIVSPGSG